MGGTGCGRSWVSNWAEGGWAPASPADRVAGRPFARPVHSVMHLGRRFSASLSIPAKYLVPLFPAYGFSPLQSLSHWQGKGGTAGGSQKIN